MRWSKFKDKDSREIFLTMQQRVFPAIKKMKYGRLPDFDENGELVEIEDDPTRPDEGNTAFARYMDDAMFLIPTPQVLQKIITGWKTYTPTTSPTLICRATCMSICWASWQLQARTASSARLCISLI